LLGYTDIEVVWTDPVDTARRVCALEGTSAVLACYASSMVCLLDRETGQLAFGRRK